MIPTPGVGVQVLSRHIRLCAFDGTQVRTASVTYRHICLYLYIYLQELLIFYRYWVTFTRWERLITQKTQRRGPSLQWYDQFSCTIINTETQCYSSVFYYFFLQVTGILPTLFDGDCFLRCDSSSPNLGILFELGVTFLRNVRKRIWCWGDEKEDKSFSAEVDDNKWEKVF